MAYTYTTFPGFTGIREDLSDMLMSPDQSPDACNMDTRSGDLATAHGFSAAASESLPGTSKMKRMYLYPNSMGVRYLALTANRLYYYRSAQHEWVSIHWFETEIDPMRVDFQEVRIGSEDRLLIVYGRGQPLLYDAVTNEVTPFGSAEKLSDVPVSYAELYFGRLFAAGNMLEPSRLYWSKAPGGDRRIDDWRSDAASENVSGGFVDVGIGDDPITGLVALSNQLLIFTENNIYRLLGDRPSNYRITAIDAAFRKPGHTACVRYADRVYFLTKDGVCFYDGQTVRRSQHAAALSPLVARSYLPGTVSAACDDRLFFAFRSLATLRYADTMIEYDLLRDRYMVRRGFSTVDLQTNNGMLYALISSRKVVCFDDSEDYDGAPIEAWWTTPLLDFGHKEANKTLLSLTATGTGTLAVRAESNGGQYDAEEELCATPYSVTEIPLRGVGRVFRLRFSNVDGRPMRLDAKATLLFDLQRRPV